MNTMNVFICLCFALLCVSSFALKNPTSMGSINAHYQQSAWKKIKPADGSEAMDITLALQHRNVERFLTTLDDLANPQSANYAKWMTKQQILDMIAPPVSVQENVMNYVSSRCPEAVLTNLQDAIKVSTTAKCVNALFDVSLYHWEHENGHKSVRHDMNINYLTIPTELRGQVEMITGVDDLPKIGSRVKTQRPKNSVPKGQPSPDTAGPYVFDFLIPLNAREIYNIPLHLQLTNMTNSLGVVEFSYEVPAPDPTDLNKFSTLNDIKYVPINNKNGPYQPGAGTESSLDVEYMTNIAVGPGRDFSYTSIQRGWIYDMALDLFNLKKTPYINSISYSWMESETCSQSGVTHAQCSGLTLQQYLAKTNTELAKLGAMGVTVVASSGDEGAPSINNEDCNLDNTHPLWPMFPADSPYVLSVGATTIEMPSQTQFLENQKNAQALPPICHANPAYPCTTGKKEMPCMANNTYFQWTAGGGFSNLQGTPQWQKDAVQTYLKSGAIIPPSKWFNSSGRAYPDTTAFGDRILYVLDGQVSVVAGTSASTPIVGAILSYLNDYRLNSGKGSIGYVNQLWYQMGKQHPKSFNGIVAGNNKWSRAQTPCQYGYGAGYGYDAVVGWGSPNFSEMKNYIASLEN